MFQSATYVIFYRIYYKNKTNLSLLDYPIKSFSELSYMNGITSHNLRELHLRNLGLFHEISRIKQLYINEICKRFNNLRLN